MMLPKWADVTATVERPGKRESRGSVVDDWAAAETHEVRGCWLDNQSAPADLSDPSAPVTAKAVLYAPPGADIKRGDKVAVGGSAYRIDGEPVTLRSPFGRVSHMAINLVDWR